MNRLRFVQLRSLGMGMLCCFWVSLAHATLKTSDDALDITATVSDSVPYITLSWSMTSNAAANTTKAADVQNHYPTWASRDFQTAPDWLGVAGNGAGFVAVGQEGVIFTSGADAQTWTQRASGTNAALQKVIWTGTGYIAVGESGTVLSSPDGLSWTARISGVTATLYSVTANGSTLVAVGVGGTIIRSTDSGVSWSPQTSPTSQSLRDVMSNGSVFVASGHLATILTSTDGITWTSRALPVGTTTAPTYAGPLYRVVWNGSLFTVFGDLFREKPGATWTTAGAAIYQSGNGTTWTRVTNTNGNPLRSVVWNAASSRYFGVTRNAQTISTTLANWSTSFSGSADFQDVTWDGTKYVAVGESGTVWVSTSLNATTGIATWAYPRGSLIGRMNDIATNGGRAVAVGASGSIMTSDDRGETWTPRDTGTLVNFTSIRWFASFGLWIATGEDGDIVTSPDGVSWTARASGITRALRRVASNGTLLVAVGDGGSLSTSPDGMTWTPQTGAAVGTDDLLGVAWGGGAFVAVGSNATAGKAYSSPDGLDWTAAMLPTSPSPKLYCVEYLGGQFVVGAERAMLYSTNGTTWLTATIPATGNPPSFTQGTYVSVAYNGSAYIAVPDGSKQHMRSADGRTWTGTNISFGTTGGIAWVADRFIVSKGGLGTAQFLVSSPSYGQIVKRRVKGADKWEAPVRIGDTATSYADTTAESGVIYEYQVVRFYTFNSTTWNRTSAAGFIHAGNKVPLVESRGAISLFVDYTMSEALAPELFQLERDLIGDGWKVIRHDVPRMQVDPASTDPAQWAARRAEIDDIRNQIRADRDANPGQLKAVYLLGRIPVPYVGQGNNDGHSNHHGAFPLDVYYGDVDSVWTDVLVDSNVAQSPAGLLDNRGLNVPGDGKLDPISVRDGTLLPMSTQTEFEKMPAPLTIAVGRVDMSNMTLFPGASADETVLLRRYLQRAHEYRTRAGVFSDLLNRSLYNDNWTFSDTGRDMLRASTGIFGRNSIDQGNVFTLSANATYTFGELGGGGSMTEIGNVGSSRQFGQQRSGAVFNWAFGSYFFDWDSRDNVLRALLASTEDSAGLSAIWFFSTGTYYYGMSMGETIGWNWLQTYRYNDTFGPSNYEFWLDGSDEGRRTGGTYGSLHGDPALRSFTFQPAGALVGQPTAGGIQLNWAASPAAGVLGYHVFRSDSLSGPFQRISGSPTPISKTNPVDNPVTTTTFTDTTAVSGQTYTYMVRAVRLEQTGGGSFYNQSSGIFTTQTAASTAGIGSPGGLTVSPISTGSVHFTWTPGIGANTGYEIQQQASDGSWSTIATAPDGSTSATATGTNLVAPGTSALYRIRATGSGSTASAWSDATAAFAASGQITFDRQDFIYNLPAASIQIEVRRVGGTVGNATVAYSTENSGAVAGIDFGLTSGTLNWADGDSSAKTLTIPLLGREKSAPRAFGLGLSNASGAILGAYPFVRVLMTDPAKAPEWLEDATPAGPVLAGASAVDGDQISSAIMSFDKPDASRFLYSPLIGNGTLTVRVTEQSPDVALSSGGQGYAGISVAESITATPRRFSMFLRSRLTAGTGASAESQVRSAAGGTVTVTSQPGLSPTPPYWLRITRTGNTFVGQTSPDGVAWTTVSTNTINNMPVLCYWGISHASNSGFSTPFFPANSYPSPKLVGNYATATFDNFTLTAADRPTTLSATPVSGNQIDLAWTGSSANASGYRIETSDSGTSGWATLAISSNTTFSHVDAPAGSRIHYRVSPIYTNPVVSGSATLTPNYYPATGRVLFRETFGVYWVIPEGWSVFRTSSGTDNTAVLFTNGLYNGEHVWGRNNGTQPLSTLYPSVLPATAMGSNRFLCFTEKYPITDAIAPLSSLVFSFQAIDNDVTPSLWRFAVRISGQWYVTEQQYAAPSTNVWMTYSVDLATNPSWHTVSFTRNASLSRSTATTTLPASGTVEAYGFFGDDGFNANAGVFWDNFTISVPDPRTSVAMASATTQTPCQAWAESQGLPGDGTGTGSLTASPAGDGIPNIFKYALGIEPLTPGWQGRLTNAVVESGGKTYLSLSYTRPVSAPSGVLLTGQSCGNLGLGPDVWSEDNVVLHSTINNGNGTETITLRDTIAIEEAAKRFLRLRAVAQ